MSLFVTFEGPEGSGKSTQIVALHEWLREKGYEVVRTREPGGTAIGDQIRRLLLDPDHQDILPMSEALLYSASRAQLVGQVIQPHLERGGIVLCDRYVDSTFAYQGYGRGMDMAALATIVDLATGGLVPDLTVYLDLPIEVGLKRRGLRRHGGELQLPLFGKWDRLDVQALDFHRRVREGYLEMARADPKRWLVVDATRPVGVIEAEIRAGVEARLS